jgi:hypothetical protein
MRTNLARTLLSLVGLCLLVAAAPAHARGEPLEWKQEDVTATVTSLIHAIDVLLADPGVRPRQATAIQQRQHDAAVSSARQIVTYAKELKRRLEAGYERDESYPFYERIAVLDDDIAAYSKHSWLPEEARKKANRAGGLLDKLARYYMEV